MAPDYITENTINIIMNSIPRIEDFERMLELSPDHFDTIIEVKPIFANHDEKDEWERNMYNRFVQWNRNCLWELSDEVLEHLIWLCDRITTNNVANMDMEHCGAFESDGIHFDKNKRLIITNGR